MHKIHLTAAALISAMLFAGCGGKDLSEKEQYDEMHTSFKYETYKTVSQSSLSFIVETYNNTKDSDSLKVKDTYMRLLLGYYWSISDSPEFAFAEADILTEESDSKETTYLASMLNSCTMYQQGWTNLAKEESDKGISLVSKGGDRKKVETETMISHLLIGTVCVQQQNYDAAKFHFAGFGQLTGIEFPYKIVDIMSEVKKGNIQSGLQKAKVLSNDPSIPAVIRTELKKAMDEVEQKGGDVNSAIFWPKLISSLILDEMNKSSRKTVNSVMGLLDSAVSKFK